jgi:hypothetical protein
MLGDPKGGRISSEAGTGSGGLNLDEEEQEEEDTRRNRWTMHIAA